jgi:outer membrane protein assembly factor BamB
MRITALFAAILILVTNVAFADWPQFRGLNSAGVATGPSPPLEFGPGKNELWRIPLGSGLSSPCIVGGTVSLTTFDATLKELAVVCIERAGGEIRWQRVVPTDQIEKGHPSFNPASSTPACDGQRVVAYFGSFGLICFDIEGQKLWEFKMPLAKSFAGNATSPAIFGNRVILYRGTYVDHFLLAVDKQSGKELWRVPQDELFTGEMACTACPIIAGDRLITHTARSIQAFDVSTGEQVWVAKCNTTATSTPVVAGDEVIVAAWNKMGEPSLRPPFPSFEKLIAEHDKNDDHRINRTEFPTLWIFHRPDGAEAPMNGGTIGFDFADKNKDYGIAAEEWSTTVRELERFRSGYNTHGMLAIRIDSLGLLGADKIRTLETQGIPEVPSPVYDGKYIYFVKNGGILTCLDVKTGQRVYRMRTGGSGTHYASPVIADGKIFTIAGDGHISILTLGANPEILATNYMQEGVYATPAIVDGTIYVRTHSTLFAFREK